MLLDVPWDRCLRYNDFTLAFEVASAPSFMS